VTFFFCWLTRTQVLLRIQLYTSSGKELVLLKSLWDGNVVSHAAASGKLRESLGAVAYYCQYLLSLLLLCYLVTMTELSMFHPRLSVKHSQQILRACNNVVWKYTYIVLTLQNSLCVLLACFPFYSLVLFLVFFDVPIQIVVSQFPSFYLGGRAEGQCLKAGFCLMYCSMFLLSWITLKTSQLLRE